MFVFPYYRSDVLVVMLVDLCGYPDFIRDYFR